MTKMGKFWIGWLFIFLLAGCREQNKDLRDVAVDLALTPDSPCVGPATVVVTLRDVENQPIVGAMVKLEGNMSHAGMVPVLADALEASPGRYEAELAFTMGGDWFILVQAALPDGRSLERKIDVSDVKAVCDTPQP